MIYSFISASLEDAAAASGIGVKQLRNACEVGDLPCYWAGEQASKRLIRAEDLDDFVKTLPTERGGAS